jgi:hypothetical protein
METSRKQRDAKQQTLDGELAMKKEDLDYTSIEVDERLLVYESCMRKLFTAQLPGMAGVINNPLARKALLRAQEKFGYARRKTLPDGRVRFEATEEYLRMISDAE